MGAQSALLGLVGTAGIGANKLAEGIKQAGKGSSNEPEKASSSSNQKEQAPISQANDGDLALKMAEKARKNALKKIQIITINKELTDRARARRIGKALKEMQEGGKR